MAGYTQQIAPAPSGLIQARQDQIAVVVISVQQKAVAPVPPVFPRQKADVLRLDRQDLASVRIVEGKDLGKPASQAVPELPLSGRILRLAKRDRDLRQRQRLPASQLLPETGSAGRRLRIPPAGSFFPPAGRFLSLRRLSGFFRGRFVLSDM